MWAPGSFYDLLLYLVMGWKRSTHYILFETTHHNKFSSKILYTKKPLTDKTVAWTKNIVILLRPFDVDMGGATIESHLSHHKNRKWVN